VRSEPGQAVIEVAAAITVILLLVVGIIEFSPAVVRAAQLTQAAREGAAYARVAPTDTFGIRKRVVQAVPSIYGSLTDPQITAMTNSDIAVTCASGLNGASKSCSSATIGDTVTVTVTRNFSVLTPMFSTLLDAPLEISRNATAEIL
jgi:Flp pilus assembly protein TadG